MSYLCGFYCWIIELMIWALNFCIYGRFLEISVGLGEEFSKNSVSVLEGGAAGVWRARRARV